MTHQQPRERVRMAQRRPAPARIRVRAARVRGLPWATIGTVIGVVAAIGGLIFSGIATYYGALVSADQLDQTREAARSAAREQANQISFWTEDEEGEAVTFHVQNRSPDPVPSIYLQLAGHGSVHAQWVPDGDNDKLGFVYWIVGASLLAPRAF